MIAWARLSLATAAIVAGGVGLGTLLATFVNPVPLEAAAPPWAGLPETRIAAPSPHDADQDYANYYPRDLSPTRDLQTAVALLDAEWPADDDPIADEVPVAEPMPETDSVAIVPPDPLPVTTTGQAKTIHIVAEEASSPPA